MLQLSAMRREYYLGDQHGSTLSPGEGIGLGILRLLDLHLHCLLGLGNVPRPVALVDIPVVGIRVGGGSDGRPRVLQQV